MIVTSILSRYCLFTADMTRFARAVGSKSCNKRAPDNGTPWNQLKDLPSEQQPSSTKSQPKEKKVIKWKRKEGEDDTPLLDLSTFESAPKKRRSDGKPATIVKFEGFSVREEDAVRLKELKRKLLAAKLPHAEIKRAMQLERRRAEKALSRDKKQVCFHCRQGGHILAHCPNLHGDANLEIESGICFKCGSTEHQHTQCRAVRGDNYKFATCFICKEEGHISKQCPDNPRGLYPEGGGCRICGDVTHMKKDCPKFGKKKKQDFEMTLSTLDPTKLEVLEDPADEDSSHIRVKPTKKRKIIKM